MSRQRDWRYAYKNEHKSISAQGTFVGLRSRGLDAPRVFYLQRPDLNCVFVRGLLRKDLQENATESHLSVYFDLEYLLFFK